MKTQLKILTHPLKIRLTALVVFLFWIPPTTAQTTSTTRPGIDVQKYTYNIRLSDTTDMIDVKAGVEILFRQPAGRFDLDLVGKKTDGKGMTVTAVTFNKKQLKFHQDNNRLIVESIVVQPGETYTFQISYRGIPEDGLIIGKNMFGERTFFGDNWPNRAHNWLVCNDHPSDKAKVEFRITAPSHYQVIASGTLKERTNLKDAQTFYQYATTVPLPTKVMVIGVARFAVQFVNVVKGIPVSSWVYPQNKTEGFYDYAQAVPVLKYYIQTIGPYPFSKLANVQSKTRYGGMENAGNIFYYEQSVTGKRNQESLIAHEIAHQWFGDSATETGWEHLWLSEGFATYFTDLYLENKYGKERFSERMQNERQKVIRFSKHWKLPVIDTVTQNLVKRLNANSYEKGAWVLHMLRQKVGDQMFWQSIRKYYSKYAYKNASTDDLKAVFEQVSGKDLTAFFQQWLYRPGHPVIKSSYGQQGKDLLMKIEQVQEDFPVFVFPLELKLLYANGSSEKVRVQVAKRSETFAIPAKYPVSEIVLDPDTHLLFETAR